VAISERTFTALGLEAELVFVVRERGPATHFLLRRAGKPEARAERVAS